MPRCCCVSVCWCKKKTNGVWIKRVVFKVVNPEREALLFLKERREEEERVSEKGSKREREREKKKKLGEIERERTREEKGVRVCVYERMWVMWRKWKWKVASAGPGLEWTNRAPAGEGQAWRHLKLKQPDIIIHHQSTGFSHFGVACCWTIATTMYILHLYSRIIPHHHNSSL